MAAVALVLIVVAIGVRNTAEDGGPVTRGPRDTRLISATEVRARMSSAVSLLTSLRGEVAIEWAVPYGDCAPQDTGGRTTLRWSFVTTSGDDERITAIGRRDDVAYRPGLPTSPPARRYCAATWRRWCALSWRRPTTCP